MRISIVANPYAGRGKARSLIESFRKNSHALGLEATLELTQGPGDGVRLAAVLGKQSDVVGIMWGDGTVHEVVNGLMPDPVPIVIIPTGTGNDVASLLRCPQGPEDLITESIEARLLPGEGDIPLAEIIRLLDEIGSNAPLGVEVFNKRHATMQPADVGRSTAEATRRLLAKARS